MKSTGIVRRIDELGRIVIPKEIRNNLRLRSGENIEIYTDNDSIIMKKFSIVNRISDLAQELTDAMYTFLKYNIFITDMHNIIAVSGNKKKELLNKELSEFMIEKIEKREKMFEGHIKDIEIIKNKIYTCSYMTNPIIKDGECIGLIVIFSEDEKLTLDELHIIEIVSSFISKYLEE